MNIEESDGLHDIVHLEPIKFKESDQQISN